MKSSRYHIEPKIGLQGSLVCPIGFSIKRSLLASKKRGDSNLDCCPERIPVGFGFSLRESEGTKDIKRER